MIEVEPPPIYYSLSGEVIQASDIQGREQCWCVYLRFESQIKPWQYCNVNFPIDSLGWGTVQIKGRINM